MEHIRAILGRYATMTSIPSPMQTDDSLSLPLAQKLGVDLSHTFANFRAVAGAKESLKAIRDLAEGISPVPFVFCYGGVGNGKTHLLEALVIRLNERRLFCRYYTWESIVRMFKHHLDRDAIPPFDELLERFCQAQRLIIDDIGMGVTDTAWELAQFETIVKYRYRNKLLTAMATNKDITDLPVRAQSCLGDKEACIICLNKGGDFRKLKGVR